jgi:IS5 family transposase
MSIDDSGLNGKISGRDIVITVENNHPLIQLAQALNWEELAEIIVPDLQSTTKKRRWWMGRPLRLRIHLGAYILQQLFNKTDRQIEYDIKDNAVYQLFCGRYLVKK